jgi:hypothetical protein
LSRYYLFIFELVVFVYFNACTILFLTTCNNVIDQRSCCIEDEKVGRLSANEVPHITSEE